MTQPRAGYGRAPEQVGPNPGRATVGGVPGGVRVAWLAAMLSLLVLAAGLLLVLGRTGDSPVPRDLLVTRASIASATAESIRKGLDESVDDLVVLADVLAEREEQDWEGLLRDFSATHPRYPVVYLVGPDLEPQHVVGAAETREDELPTPLPATAGLSKPQEAGASPVLLAWAPVPVEGEEPRLLVGRYDVAFFGVPLGQLAPGDAYLVDERARIVGATLGFQAFDRLPGRLEQQARGVLEGRQYVADVVDGDVQAASAVRGDSPAGRLGLAVVSSVEPRSLALPAYDARRLLLLTASLTALLGALSLFWFWLAVIAPVRRLAAEAERIAFGDRSQPVHVVRYDEIGLVTRALERCRSLLTARPARRR